MAEFFNPAGRNISGALELGRERRLGRQTQDLLGAIPTADPFASPEFQELARVSPEAAQKFVQTQGAVANLIGTEDTKRQQAFFDDVKRAGVYVKNERPDLAFDLLSNRRQMLGNIEGANTELTEEGLEMLMNGDTEGFLEAVDMIGQLELATKEVDLTAGEQEFKALIEDLSPEDQAKAKRIKAGLDPRAVGSAVQTITDEGTAEKIAETEQIIAEGKEFGKLTGASRSKAIDTAFDNIQKIDANVRNLDKAIAAIDEGASTGAIESRFFPTLREATVQLEQVQRELGLDVIGSVTFGALSQGELDLALETALPTNLQPEALRDYLVNRKTAQDKLRNYYREQMDFLDKGGTVSGFLRSKEREQPDQTEAQPQVLRFDNQGNLIQ